jgi:orotate phosphoribosyltransferase
MAEKITTTNEAAVAEKLLQAQAIRLNVKEPFTWSSGWTSPIYCDNRIVLGHPYIRDFIKSELCNMVFAQFPEAGLLAGVATAGIPWGAMVADQLKLPYVYVRSKPKEHGLGQQIEGFYEKDRPVVVMEDLISTGKSSLQVVDVLRQAGLEVIGLVSIFNYGFPAARAAFQAAGVPYLSLSDYPTLISLALDKKLVSPEEEAILLNWSEDPANWKGV